MIRYSIHSQICPREPKTRLRCALVVAAVTVVAAIAGCGGRQSTLNPAGEGADVLAVLFWWMAISGVVIWLVVVGLFAYACFIRPAAMDRRRAVKLIIGGGAVFPTVVLTGLLAYGLSLLPELQRPAPNGSLEVEVTGVQWWWRVRYPDSDHPSGWVETANEIVLPVDQSVQFRLLSEDVIHSFWIPSLGGKTDMIPGRINEMKLQPNRLADLRGVCAEYCGESHALMAFDVKVLDSDAFAKWLTHQRADAQPARTELQQQGQRLFLASGCGACHAIRGTSASGIFGPDLTHLGSRASIAAGILPNDREHLMQWIAQPDRHKPGVKMPSYEFLTETELAAIVAYLQELR